MLKSRVLGLALLVLLLGSGPIQATPPAPQVDPTDVVTRAVPSPGSPSAQAVSLYQDGVAKLQQNNYPAAISALQAASGLDPGNAEIVYQLGTAQMGGGQYGDARRSLSRAIQLNPNEPAYHYGLAVMYLKTSDLNRAIGELIKTTQLAPTQAGPWFTLGNVYDQKQDLPRAIQAYSQYVRLAAPGPTVDIATNRLRELQGQYQFQQNQDMLRGM